MNDAQARDVLARAWPRIWSREGTPLELDYAQAVARLETGYGRAGQFAAMAEQGIFNWGAMQRGTPDAEGHCPSGMVPGVDAGNPRCFFGFASDEDAAAAFVRTLTKDHGRAGILDPMNADDAAGVAHVMKATGYYEAPESTYATALLRNLAAVRGGTTVPRPSGAPLESGGLGFGAVLTLGAVGLGVFLATRHR